MPKIKVNPSLALDAYIAEMLQEKGLAQGNEQQRAELASLMRDQLDDLIDRTIIDALPEEKYPELEALLDRDAADEEIERFFDNAGVDFEKAVQVALEQYRANFLNDNANAGGLNSTMTTTISNDAAAVTPTGNPMQGTNSEVPGASDVEGIAEQTTVTEEMQNGE